jgi:hypothetical protein
MFHTDDRLKNSLMKDNFVDVVTEDKKLSQHKYKHCDHQSTKSVARSQQHLQTCDAFIREQQRKQKIELSQNARQLFITAFIRSLSQAQIAHAHRAIAMSLYMTNLSFNHFENLYVIAHHQVLNSSYKSSNHKLVSEKLLNEAYETIKNKIKQKLNACNHLSFFIDETINIRKERVINLCCHVFNEKEFHLKAMIEVAEIMSASVQAE